jgi:hypothetical protein
MKYKKRTFFYSAIIVATILMQERSFAQIGTWVAAPRAPHNASGGLTLLTDGRVISHTDAGGNYGTHWDRLTPDSTGSYINGTWDVTMAPMLNDRLFFSTQVLQDGRVYVAGGEYGNGDTAAEVYNSITNTWTCADAGLPHGWRIYDGNSELLYNGTVLEGPQIGASPSFDNLLWSPVTMSFSPAPSSFYNHDEAQWLKLPDSSVLFVGIASNKSNRYIPALNIWVKDDTVPVNLYDVYGEEAGAAMMLPNGKAIFFGASGHNAIYTPSGDTSPGVWTVAADFPKIGAVQVAQVDAPAAMMVNGRILCAASPLGISANDEFRDPVYFFEYDYTTNTFTQVTSILPGLGCDSLPGTTCSQINMLDLPDGNVLVAIDQTTQLRGPPLPIQYYIYQPGSGPIAAGIPTLSNVYQANCNYYITGTLFNGISEGAAYGDDWEMETNYPIVRLTIGTRVYYARTSYWNRIGAVQTGALPDTAQFTLPAGMPAGTYSVVVIANGFASNPFTYTFNPYTVTPSVLANENCNGSVKGNATATVHGGSGPYTYNWSNGSTTNPTGAVLTKGTYTVIVTDSAGCTVSATVAITQASLAVTSDSVAASTDSTCDGSAWAKPMGGVPPYTYSWSPGGATTDTIKNICNGNYCCTVTDNSGCSGTTCVKIATGILVITSNTSSIHVFPNPTNGILTVTGTTQGQIVELYNYLGQKLYSSGAGNNTFHLDISSQAKGLYFLRILNKDATVADQKRVIKTN